MGLDFDIPWLVVAAAALALAAIGLAARVRKPAPVLFALCGALLLLAGARPAVTAGTPQVTHALIEDVSASMGARRQVPEKSLPAGHSLRRFELSDALRQPGSPGGRGTDYSRLADLGADAALNGEFMLATDGRGRLADLLTAADPRRLMLLRLPPHAAPDASIVDFIAPSAVSEGGSAMLRASIVADRDCDVPWRMLVGERVVASGTRSVRAGLAAGISHNLPVQDAGLVRVRLVLDLAQDREPGNDEASVAFYAGSRRVMLYCAPRDFPQQADGLLATLRNDARNEVRVAHALPSTPRDLDGVGTLFINNLPLADAGVSREQLRAIRDWVLAGGNLMMLGAEGAFGPGGYRGTAIEDILPVRLRPDDAPPRRLLLLLDVSESMGQTLPGGVTRLQRLREAASRVLQSAAPTDAAAIVGFNQRLQNEAVFRAPSDPMHETVLAGLQAQLGTNIRGCVADALPALGQGQDRRLMVITDGEDTASSEAAWRELADRLKTAGVRLDVILTDQGGQPWQEWLAGADVHYWAAGADGFSNLLETLDRAIAGGDSSWVSTERWEVGGVPEPLLLLARTAPRNDRSVTPTLTAQTPRTRVPEYPLLAHRQLVGRTACLCTRSWGDGLLANFWASEFFQQRIALALDFVTANANRQNLVLNILPDSAELVWTGASQPPDRDLRLGDGALARLQSTGRWLLAPPTGDELLAFDGEVLLQRIALPKLVPHELRYTGDDEAFFTMAEQAGVRVVSSLDAWQPKRFGEIERQPVDLTWLPALAALACLLAGFALRRR